MEANWRYAVLAASHEDQKNIALTTILALLACKKEMDHTITHLHNRGVLNLRERNEADKALRDYVASFDAHRTQTDAMLDALCRALEHADHEYAMSVLACEKADAHRTKLREIMDCARRDIRGTIYFRDEERKRLEELSQ
jgi:hypothetical protein